MKIARISIENFRSIRSAEIYPTDVCALVGENNAGKTNILRALDFLLGETWPSRRSLDVSDYYHGDTESSIYIEVEFEDNPDDISRVWCEIPWEERTTTRMEYASGKTYPLSNAIRERCALVYLDAGRSLEYHLDQSRWTLFGRITRRLNENFRDNFADEKNEELERLFKQAHEVLRTELYADFETLSRKASGSS
jgi:putative ATP-dependent endonuclease of OLD family